MNKPLHTTLKKTLFTLIMLGACSVGSVSANDTTVQSRVDQIKSEFNLDEQQAKRIAMILNQAGMSKEEKRSARMEKRLQRRVEHMTRALQLNDTQAAQVKAILNQQGAQMRAMRTQSQADITALLTPEQATQFAQMSERHQGRKGRHGKRHGKRGNKCTAD